MPQAKLKAKIQVPNAAKKKGNPKKKSNVKRKGGRVITPKKAKLLEKHKLKKTLTQSINKHIEKEVILQAGKQNVGLTLVEKKNKDKERSKVDELDSESSEEEEEMTVDGGEEVNVEFEGFPLSDHDFDGIKQLLTQQFTESCTVSLSALANALIAQNFLGTVLKQSELPVADDESDATDDDDIFALITCYSLTRSKDELTSSVAEYLLAKCKASGASSETKEQFVKVINDSTSSDDVSSCSSCLALIVSERIVNVPPQAALPMYEKLADEISNARSRKHKARYDFSHYVMLCKIFDMSGGPASAKQDEVLFQNSEEELFADESTLSFDYKLTTSSDDDVTKTRRALLLTREGFGRALKQLKKHLAV